MPTMILQRDHPVSVAVSTAFFGSAPDVDGMEFSVA